MGDSNARPEVMNLEMWRPLTKREIGEFLERLEQRTKERLEDREKGRGRRTPRPRGVGLIVRKYLSQLDVFCYLKARFGEPNGFQNYLRNDDSDNLIHWEYQIRSGAVDLHIMGADRQIHFWVGEPLTDEHWRELIFAIKSDFARVGVEKSRVLRSLEKWVVYPNKYVQIANVCSGLYDNISENVQGFEQYRRPSAETMRQGRARGYKLAKRLSERADKVHGASVQLALLTPILAEAFINMVILMLCKPEIRNHKRLLESFIRSHIHTKVFSLAKNCIGFAKPIDKDTPGFSEFKRVMDQRNHAIHGNIDPVRERIETVYFEGKRPLFAETGDHIGRFFEAMERQYQPQRVLDDYLNTHSFLIEIVENMEPPVRYEMWRLVEDPYPGYDARRQRSGNLFPHYVVSGYPVGLRYDDELNVDWTS